MYVLGPINISRRCTDIRHIIDDFDTWVATIPNASVPHVCNIGLFFKKGVAYSFFVSFGSDDFGAWVGFFAPGGVSSAEAAAI